MATMGVVASDGMPRRAQRDLVAVEVRDVDVHQDQVRHQLGRDANALEAGGGVHHRVPRGAQQLGDQAPVHGVVFDVQDGGHGFSCRA
jgi:hypothetical protein